LPILVCRDLSGVCGLGLHAAFRICSGILSPLNLKTTLLLAAWEALSSDQLSAESRQPVSLNLSVTERVNHHRLKPVAYPSTKVD